MLNYTRKYLEHVSKKKKGPEAKYTIYSYFIAFQHWAYEVIDKVGSKYATHHGSKNS